ncbi:MAG: Flp pilus assembly complex ATPase component TadA [Faecalibacterium sp.]|jgi:stage III sporulation protein AA|nr:Flp pilus assembly complex ATPase component TadA [Faecalibacterium sp.]
MDEYYDAIAGLPPWLAEPLRKLPPEKAAAVHEIRLRQGCPIWFTVRGEPIAAAAYCPQVPALARLTVVPERMEEVLFTLCGGSVHSFEDELSGGYFTLSGGHRVGVGGQYVRGPDGNTVLQRVESLNLRIARILTCEVPVFLRLLLREHFTGLLLAGEPDSGKTTLLRSLIPLLGEANRTVAVIDERGELLPAQAAAQTAYARCDRVAGLDKASALQMALRTLGPQVILLDELGTLAETELLEQGFFSGVDFIATLHAASLAEAEQKPQVRFLLAHRMLHSVCLLAGRKTPGCVKEGRDYC